MQLSTKAVTSFQEIYHTFYGTSLTPEEANDKGVELLEYMKFLLKPIPVTDREMLEGYRVEKSN